MKMHDNHECLIGLWNYDDGSEMKTLNEIVEIINQRNKIMFCGSEYVEIYKELGLKEYRIDDLFDLRKNRLPITRFKYCPECGNKIDWKGMKNEHEKG